MVKHLSASSPKLTAFRTPSSNEELFQNINGNPRIAIPPNWTSLGANCISGTTPYGQDTLVIPPNIATIESNGISVINVKFIDFSQHISIPTLVASTSISTLPDYTIIQVPNALYATWITEPNWVLLADYIVGV